MPMPQLAERGGGGGGGGFRMGGGVQDSYTFQCGVGSFTSPGIDTI